MILRKFFITVQAVLVLINVTAQQIIIESGQEGLGLNVNSQYFEQSPVISSDGMSIYFVRSGDPQNSGGTTDKGDIWMSGRLDDGSWNIARRINSPINTAGRNGIIGFQNDFMLLNYHYDQSGGGFSVSRKSGDAWEKPVNVRVPYFKSQSEFESATISPDGRAMIFSIQSFGTYGVEDLYYTTMSSNGEWSDLRNVGPTINTPYQEMTPFISPDGQYLYFASNGRGGFGGMDIFVSERLDDGWRSWSEPVNLGPLVNTIGSESSFSFLPDADWAILVSTQNSDGYGDLKKVGISFPSNYILPEDSIITKPLLSVIYDISTDSIVSDLADESNLNVFTGRLINIKDGQPINGSVRVIGETDTLDITSSIDSGFQVELAPGDFQITAMAADYLEYDTLLTLSPEGSLAQNFYLQPLEIGNTIALKHVLFERGTTNLITGSEIDLKAVYNMLVNNPSIEILVEGHTDNQGAFQPNVELSQQRVDAVIEYMTERGIQKRRIKGKGWGPMKPIVSNATEESRKKNRRVEFTITKK